MARFDKLEFEAKTLKSSGCVERKETARDRPAWHEQAIEERRCGHYENALRMYSRALEDDKSLVHCWLGQVQMLIMLDEAVEGELWSRKALELFPGNGDLMAGRAQAMRRIGNASQAQVLSDGSLKAAGLSAYRWMVRGELMAAVRQQTDRHCFDKAVLADRDWLVPLEIAQIYLALGLPSRALDRIRCAVELAPDRYFPWYVQGQVERELGLKSAATRSWQHCLDICPGHADAERGLLEFDESGSSFQQFWRRIFGSK